MDNVNSRFRGQNFHRSAYAGGSPRFGLPRISSSLSTAPFCSNAHTLPFALGSGFVAQKNIVFAVFLNVESVSPFPVVHDVSFVRVLPDPLL